MIRFYCPDIAVEPVLPESDSGHCIRVLRMKAGDFIRMAPDTEHSLRGITPVKITVTKINA